MALTGTGGVANLKVIRDHGIVPSIQSFEIHTRVFLAPDGVEPLREVLASPSRSCGEVLAVLKAHGKIEDEATLRRLLVAGLGPGTPELLGTGGVANFEVIVDYAKADAPVSAFQIHTEVVLQEDTDPAEIERMIKSSRGKPNAVKKLADHLEKVAKQPLKNPDGLRALLAAALGIEVGRCDPPAPRAAANETSTDDAG